MIVKELKSIVDYLRQNWAQALLSLAFGLIVFWVLTIKQLFIEASIADAKDFLPPISLVLTFGWLIGMAMFLRVLSFWSYYRNLYFIKEPHFALADRLLITLIPLFYWCYFQSFFSTDYFQSLLISIAFYFGATYIATLFQIWNKHVEQKKLGEDKFLGKTILFSDEPISDTEKDLIGRGGFAKALKENIYNLSFKESFVMGLYGQWGEGKTSILNLLKKEIRSDDCLLIYEFDPWFFGDENALTTNFYRGLEDMLKEKYFIPRKIKKLLKFYPEVLIKGLTSIGIDFHNKNEEDRPIELKKQIEEFIAGLDKRILVVIDDIDRLQKDEILAVFRLIKLTSHIKNLVFLVSLDVPRVIKILKAGGEIEDPESYVEKIVQLPINLPMTDQSQIDKFLLYSFPAVEHKSEIDKLFDRIGLDPEKRLEFDKEFVKIYQSDLKQIFSTYRAAKRYLNSILFRLPFIEREVFLYDFFIVEVIQTFYPGLYADMKSSPWYYFSSKWSWESMVSPLPYDDNERKQAIKNHIEVITKDMPKKEVVISLLESIFPEIQTALSRGGVNYHVDSGNARIQKRITHPECYSKYFMLGTRESAIPDAEFEDMLKCWEQSEDSEAEIATSFFDKYQGEFKLIQLFERLKLHSHSLDTRLILPIIKTIYKNSKKLQRDGAMFMTEFDQADGVLFRLIEDRKDVIKDEEIHPLFEEIIKQTPDLHLASLIVLSCVERNGGSSLARVRGNVNIDKLREVLEKRLKEHFIDGNRDVFEEYLHEREFAFILYQWANNWAGSSTSTKPRVNDYLIKLFKEKPEKLSFFLGHGIKEARWPDEKKYFDYSGFNVAYEPNKFAELINELGEGASSSAHDKEIINLFLEKHRQASTPAVPVVEIIAPTS